MIARMVGLSVRMLWTGGRRAWTSAALVAAAVAVGTTLLTITLGALHGWDAREARIGWRIDDRFESPVAASGTPVASVLVHGDLVAGLPMTVVDLVDARPDVAPPPGLSRVPAAGEVWMSPALADLAARLPADRLALRFPGPVTGTVGEAGLTAPDELVAVVGRAGPLAGATPVADFGSRSSGLSQLAVYRQLTLVAVALLAFPVLSLLTAAARLTAARRAERLATLRLLGASTAQITVVAVAEVTAVAAVAAAVGVACEWVLAPLLAHIPLDGTGWYAADLRPIPLVLLAVVVAVAVVAAGAAIGGMRQVVVSPLGVARRQRPGGARLLRLVGVAAGLLVFGIVNVAIQGGAAVAFGATFGIGVLALFGVVSLAGPLVVRLVGASMARSARSVPRLLAGRRLLDDPKAAFRPLAGLTLAVFVAGFLSPLAGAVEGNGVGDDTALRVHDVPAERVSEQLARQGIVATVVPDRTGVDVTPAAGVDRDVVRTALAPVVSGEGVLSRAESDAWSIQLVADLVRGAVIVLVGTFLIAATSAGTTAAARVLDQRRSLRLLRLAGTPLRVLDAARRAETLRPLLVNGGIALAMGLLCASPFAAASQVLTPSGLVLLGGVLAGGVVLVLLASAASRPLLRSVTEARDGLG